jgi:hypothetical protein
VGLTDESQSLSCRVGLTDESQSPRFVEEEIPFKYMYKSGKRENIFMGPETKNDCAGEGQQKFNGLKWTTSVTVSFLIKKLKKVK